MAPNIFDDLAGRAAAKRSSMRRAKKTVRRPPEVLQMPTQAAAHADPCDDTPRAGKLQKLGDGGAALLGHLMLPCGGEDSATSEVSPPLAKVQERHAAFAEHAKANRARGPSALATSVRQPDGGGERELEWLSHTVAVVRLAGGTHR